MASKPQSLADLETQRSEAFELIGVSVKTCNENDQAVEDINALWQFFYENNIVDMIPEKQGNAVMAAYTDYEGDHTKPYKLVIGCRVKDGTEAPEGMEKVHVPETEYLAFSAQGEQPKALINTWQNIWKSDLPRCYGVDLEIYGPRFFEPDVHEVLVLVGVNKP